MTFEVEEEIFRDDSSLVVASPLICYLLVVDYGLPYNACSFCDCCVNLAMEMGFETCGVCLQDAVQVLGIDMKSLWVDQRLANQRAALSLYFALALPPPSP